MIVLSRRNLLQIVGATAMAQLPSFENKSQLFKQIEPKILNITKKYTNETLNVYNDPLAIKAKQFGIYGWPTYRDTCQSSFYETPGEFVIQNNVFSIYWSIDDFPGFRPHHLLKEIAESFSSYKPTYVETYDFTGGVLEIGDIKWVKIQI